MTQGTEKFYDTVGKKRKLEPEMLKALEACDIFAMITLTKGELEGKQDGFMPHVFLMPIPENANELYWLMVAHAFMARDLTEHAQQLMSYEDASALAQKAIALAQQGTVVSETNYVVKRTDLERQDPSAS